MLSLADLTPEAALAALAWHLEAGVDEILCDTPQDRYAEAAEGTARKAAPAPAMPAVAPARAAPPLDTPQTDAATVARQMASKAADLPALAEAMARFDLCELRQGARSMVFADGNPAARVMIIGEAPGREEDQQGLPFVGAAGRLLDRMFGAIGLSRAHPDAARALYITNTVPWRPPANREPTPGETAMLRPFLERHVELADPDLIVLMGNVACGAVLNRRGITALRGTWVQAFGRPALPMFHPANLLRSPDNKRPAWADLLALRARLEGVG